MLHKIIGQGADTVRVAQDTVHLSVGLLALFNLVFAGPLFGAPGVILFNLSKFSIIKQHFGSPAFINDAHGDLIGNRFGHGVGVHHLAKYIQSGVNGCTGKTHIGGIGQGIMQVLGKAISFAHRLHTVLFGDTHLLIKIDLAPVRLIGYADHIVPVGQEFRVFGELVDGSQKHAAAVPAF